MAHFAELDANNNVLRVIVVSNADMIDDNGDEQEALGIAVCQAVCGADTTWVQTSYNNNFRKKYAGIGDKFDALADVFYNPVAPYPSWTLDEQFDWQAPTPYPSDGKMYAWDEPSLSWVEIVLPEAGE